MLRVIVRPDENPYCAIRITKNGPEHLGEFCQDFSPEVVAAAIDSVRNKGMLGTVEKHGEGWGIRASRRQLTYLAARLSTNG